MEAVLQGPTGSILLGTKVITIGRDSSNQLTLNDREVSRRHAIIQPEGQGYSILDIGSSNGIFVNGQKIAPNTPHSLKQGDVITIGKSRLTFVMNASGTIMTPPFPQTPTRPYTPSLDSNYSFPSETLPAPQTPPFAPQEAGHPPSLNTGAMPAYPIPVPDQSNDASEFNSQKVESINPYVPPSPPIIAPYERGRRTQKFLETLRFTGIRGIVGRLFSGKGKSKTQKTQLKLFAIAHTQLESDDRAFVGKIYFIEAGISQNRLEGFTSRRFTVDVQDPTAPIPFDIVVHAEKNIEFLHGWHQRLRYIPTNTEPKLVRFPFKVTAEGKAVMTINFYREQQWLQTVELEFEGVDQSQLAKTIYGRDI